MADIDVLSKGLQIPIRVNDETRIGIKGAKRNLRGFEKSSASTSAAMVRHFRNIAIAVGGVAAVMMTLRAGFRFMSESVELAGVQELAEKKLATAIGHTSQALLDQAAALQKVSTYGDETIIEAQALIGAFVKDENQIKAATRATLDLAAAKGMKLTVAADLVSKTLGSSTNALSRYGIQVEGAVGSTERLDTLTRAISDKFGGQAAAAAQTFTGRLEQLSNVWGDVKEEIGFTITKSEKFNTSLVNLTQTVKNMAPELVALAGKFARFAEDWATGMGIILDSFTVNKQERIAQITSEIERLEKVLETPPQSGLIFKWFQGTDMENAREKLAELRREYELLTAPQDPSSGAEKIQEQINLKNEILANDKEMMRTWEEEDALRLEELYASQLARLAEQERAKTEIVWNAEFARVEAQKKQDAVLVSMRAQTVNNLIGLMQVLGAKSKAWAIAGIVLQKGVAIAEIIINSLRAATAAFAPPPLGLGPVAGVPLAAAMKTYGAMNATLVAAQGIGQIAAMGSSPPATGGTAGEPLPATGVNEPAAEVSKNMEVTIILQGDHMDPDSVARAIIPALQRAIDDGEEFNVAVAT